MPGALPYATAKAAIEGLTRALAVDYAPRGIRVNAVALGSIAPSATTRPSTGSCGVFIHSAVSAAAKKSLLSSITFSPTTRASSPGAVVPVDGGRAALGQDPEARDVTIEDIASDQR